MERCSPSVSSGPAVACFARAPSAAGKTRLAAHIPEPRLRALRTALLADALLVVSSVPDAARFVFFMPDDAEAEIAALAGERFTLVRQRGDDLGQRMHSAFEEMLVARRFDAAVLTGSDIPLLTLEYLDAALEALRVSADLVLGPTEDGGYYLIGMRAVEARLFDGIVWGTATVLADTLRAAERPGFTARVLPPAYDIDTIDDLRRLERDLAVAPAGTAPHTAEWFGKV